MSFATDISKGRSNRFEKAEQVVTTREQETGTYRYVPIVTKDSFVVAI